MMNNQQEPVEIQDTQDLSEEGKQLVQIFTDMKSKQLEFLDEASKSLIERIATFLAVLFAVTAFSNNFPPPYLKGNMPAKIMVILTLILYLLAMAAALLASQPRLYTIPRYNVTEMGKRLQNITTYKMRRLRLAGILFALGSLALAILIITIILEL
ncbi:hypothetical protein [Ktedonospora formicarum]|uniref:Uncharacterized protein n=1 Tax=Ktedonospora formicarum TaxID=2778364 RepID=A0A8J3I855_9CHLR|nr:hypothetical protein [Ktedonospora formicarum]GHO47568.1 hypothetical protein KSX_57310 [Ktedonospora formicarum]